MIRIIDYKAVDLSEEEFLNYTAVLAEFGNDVFHDLFESDEATGYLTLVKPPLNRQISLGVLFFLLNVMLNQRIRTFDKMQKEMIEKMKI